jgi:protoporphyrinogen oxidase
MEFVKVIIVGGGAAGLGAAKTLGPNVNYLLIEAQDYLGGRIRTIDAGCICFSLVIIELIFKIVIDDQFRTS